MSFFEVEADGGRTIVNADHVIKITAPRVEHGDPCVMHMTNGKQIEVHMDPSELLKLLQATELPKKSTRYV